MTGPVRRPFVRLEDLLLRHGAITQEQLQHAKEEQKKWGGQLGRIFVDLGYVTEELLLRATAHQLGAKFVDPTKEVLDQDIVRAIGVQICEQFGVIAVAGDLKKKVLKVATSDPENRETLVHLTTLTAMSIEPVPATSASIHAAIRRYFYGESGPRAPQPAAPASAPAAPVPAPAAPAPLPAPAAVSSAEVAALERRIAQLEMFLGSLRKDLTKVIATDPQIAGLTARLEALEQISSSDVGSLRAVVELLLDRKVFNLDDLKAKVKSVRERGG